MPHFWPIAFLLFAASTSGAFAASELERGRAILEENCGRCHATGEEGASPLAAAPPFRELGERYPVSDLEEALAEGIVTGHPAMPEFSFDPDEIDAIVAYLEALQPK
jgi:mono/diheme cytochrome c family protein